MKSRLSILRGALAALALVATIAWTGRADAQNIAGVLVDAEGVLKQNLVPGGAELNQKLAAAAKASLNKDVAKASQLRMVSLNRLEKAIEEKIAAGQPVNDEMKYLAGLKHIKYVFFYPESGDIVVAGPAEGWFTDNAGRVLSTESQEPTLHLEDLVTALRAFPAGKKGNTMIGCSIDPTQEGLNRMQQFLAKTGRNLTDPNVTRFIVKGLKDSLGMQTITVMGVPGSTHFAQVLVEADYRMKLIGIGLEEPAVKIPAYTDLVNPAQMAANALQRWYFLPDYDSVKVSEDNNAFELSGRGVKLLGEEEMVAQGGQRAVGGSINKASKQFTDTFTAKYPELAAKSPVYAELRNMIDLSIVAAFVQQQDFYGKADWKMSTLGDEKLFEVETYNIPAKVESAVNAIFKRNMLMTPIGGGVEIRAKQALATSNVKPDTDGSLAKARDGVKLNLGKGQWWWD